MQAVQRPSGALAAVSMRQLDRLALRDVHDEDAVASRLVPAGRCISYEPSVRAPGRVCHVLAAVREHLRVAPIDVGSPQLLAPGSAGDEDHLVVVPRLIFGELSMAWLRVIC